MRYLMFGGSFNPVHLGHLELAAMALKSFSYDRAILVPALIPPHKALSRDPGPAVRLEMLRLAVEGDGRFIVESRELDRGGVSYSVDTVRELGPKYGAEGKLGLLIGDDLAEGFGRWKDPDVLASLADIVLARRKGSKVAFPWPHADMENELLPFSSSEVRARIAAGLDVRGLVPEAVRLYISTHGLYVAA